jgi:F420-non-reducing hydrogenase small subunit
MTSDGARPRLGMYSAAGCGGCDVAVLNLGERLPALAQTFDIVFAPMLADFKVADLAALPDAGIDLCLFNGTIRTPADEDMAHLLRRKSRFMVAFGACAESGGVPALANTSTVDEMLERVAAASGAGAGAEAEASQPARHATAMPALPRLCPTACSLEQVELVDYTIPGCPPEPAQVWAALETLAGVVVSGTELPWPGATLGASAAALCEECPLTREDRKVQRFRRLHESAAAPDRCLLEQGFVCLGVATRGGCGALCPQVGIPCSGCYGQPDGVADQGARLVAALAAALDAGTTSDGAAVVSGRVAAAIAGILDPIGTFYGFTLQRSLLARPRPARSRRPAEERHEAHHH